MILISQLTYPTFWQNATMNQNQNTSRFIHCHFIASLFPQSPNLYCCKVVKLLSCAFKILMVLVDSSLVNIVLRRCNEMQHTKHK